MGQDTSEGDSGTDEGIELLVTANGELQMAGSNTLDFKILSSITCELKNFCCQVFQNSSNVDGSWRESRVNYCWFG